ncbi:hypothetical protein [Chryseobacterium sp.]|uniref:hypothetical protein n=1 Tax=Chryseobacterium sp. TaxID=1871047 RepID=UPI00289E1D53|nr:hypothetical protein [Chryseobacterium sp.]
MPKLQSTEDGLIYVKASLINQMKRPNNLEGAKSFGKQVIINVNHIGFLSHNSDGIVAFFMANGFEISINVFFDQAEQILRSAKAGRVDEIF